MVTVMDLINECVGIWGCRSGIYIGSQMLNRILCRTEGRPYILGFPTWNWVSQHLTLLVKFGIPISQLDQ